MEEIKGRLSTLEMNTMQILFKLDKSTAFIHELVDEHSRIVGQHEQQIELLNNIKEELQQRSPPSPSWEMATSAHSHK